MRMTIGTLALAVVLQACSPDAPAPEGTYTGRIEADETCSNPVEYSVTLFYDGEFLEGSESETHLLQLAGPITTDSGLKGRYALGQQDFILERVRSDGTFREEPATFSFRDSTLIRIDSCGGGSREVLMTKLR